ncbi:hypothetical protein GGI42DRAFT_174587 [Trichoderma sp. SZMC 28013]
MIKMTGTPQSIDSFVPLYVSPCILLALYSLFGGEQSHAQFLVSSLSVSFPMNRERNNAHSIHGQRCGYDPSVEWQTKTYQCSLH